MEKRIERETLTDLTASAFAPGSIIAGKYLVERELASGGVGVVVLAIHVELGQRVAIKYLRPDRLGDQAVVERFKREARLAASLCSDHIVRIYDVGSLDEAAPFIVMEYLDGEDLSQVLARGGPLTTERAIQWTLEVCEALAEAHSIGIVHRDLKPANLFLARRGTGTLTVKIVDFGISKLPSTEAVVGSITRHNECFGTPAYMSPEQLVSSANVDARSDIWAIGVVLYELLTGRLPFEGADLRQLITEILNSRATPIRDVRPDLPLELAQIIHACLSSDPQDRPNSVTELAESLQPFTCGGDVRPVALTETSLDVSGLHDLVWIGAAPKVASRITVGVVGAMSLVLGAAVAITVAAWRAPPSVQKPANARAEVVFAPPPSATAIADVMAPDSGAPVTVAPTSIVVRRPPVLKALIKKAPAPPPVAEYTDFGGRR